MPFPQPPEVNLLCVVAFDEPNIFCCCSLPAFRTPKLQRWRDVNEQRLSRAFKHCGTLAFFSMPQCSNFSSTVALRLFGGTILKFFQNVQQLLLLDQRYSTLKLCFLFQCRKRRLSAHDCSRVCASQQRFSLFHHTFHRSTTGGVFIIG